MPFDSNAGSILETGGDYLVHSRRQQEQPGLSPSPLSISLTPPRPPTHQYAAGNYAYPPYPTQAYFDPLASNYHPHSYPPSHHHHAHHHSTFDPVAWARGPQAASMEQPIEPTSRYNGTNTPPPSSGNSTSTRSSTRNSSSSNVMVHPATSFDSSDHLSRRLSSQRQRSDDTVRRMNLGGGSSGTGNERPGSFPPPYVGGYELPQYSMSLSPPRPPPLSYHTASQGSLFHPVPQNTYSYYQPPAPPQHSPALQDHHRQHPPLPSLHTHPLQPRAMSNQLYSEYYSHHYHHSQSPEHTWPTMGLPLHAQAMSHSSSAMLGSTVPPPPALLTSEWVTELSPNDVLSGRGGATNSYRGNRAFRSLVKTYQKKYLDAKKRDKPAVASIVVDLIRQKGGRFLRRCSNSEKQMIAAAAVAAAASSNNHGFPETDPYYLISGQVIWVDIGDDRAREKTCQALREGAPEIRKKTRAHSRPVRHKSKYANTTSGASLASSSFEDENADDDEDFLEDEVDPTTEAVGDGVGSRKPNSSSDDDAAMALSPNPSGNFRKRVEGYERYDSDGRRVGDIAMQSRGMSRHHASGEVAGGGGGDVGDSRDDTDMDRKPSSLPSSPGGDTIWIRPWHRLLPDRSIVTPIAVDQLSKEDREMYLRDFLPPNPQEEYRSSQKQPPPSGPRNHPTTIVPSAESRSPEGRHEVEKQSSSPPLQSDSHADGGRMSA